MGNINDDLLDFDIPTWAVTSLVNSDDSGLEDDDIEKLNKFTDEIVAKYGNANFMMGSDEEMESQFKYKNDIDGVLGADVVTMYLQPTKNYAKGNTVKGMQVLEISIEQGKSRSIPKVKRIGSSYPYKNYLGVYSVNTLEEANELVKDISDFIIYKIKYFDGEGVGLPKYAIYIAENNYAKGTTIEDSKDIGVLDYVYVKTENNNLGIVLEKTEMGGDLYYVATHYGKPREKRGHYRKSDLTLAKNNETRFFAKGTTVKGADEEENYLFIFKKGINLHNVVNYLKVSGIEKVDYIDGTGVVVVGYENSSKVVTMLNKSKKYDYSDIKKMDTNGDKWISNYAKGTTIKFDKLPKNRQADKNYDYFAVGKIDGKIVDGWEIVDDVESLKYYAKIDLKDNDYNPKNFNIVSAKYLIRKGINPFDYNNWRKIDYSTNESAYATKFLEGEIYANGGGITKKPTQSQLDKMTAFNLMDAMKNDKKNYQLYKKQLLKLYPDAKGFSNGGGIDENDIKQGDYVDFESYGEFYVCNPSYSDNYFWVTKEKEDRYDSNAQGYSVPKSSAIEIIETDEEYADGGGIKAIFSKEGIEASNPFAFKKKLEFAKKHPELLMLETGGKIEVGDTIYRAFFTDDDGELSSILIKANSREEAEKKADIVDDGDMRFTYVSNPIKIKNEEQLFEETRENEPIYRYNNGGGIGKVVKTVKGISIKLNSDKDTKNFIKYVVVDSNGKEVGVGFNLIQDAVSWIDSNYAKGTTIEEFNYNPKIDYLSEYHLLPKKVQDIIFKEEYEDSTYESNNKLIKELNGIGWTADYDLSASIYDLKPIDKYAKGNTIEGEKSVKISGFPPIKLSSAKILYKDFEENFNSDLFRFVKHYNSLHKAKNTIADYKMVLEFGSDKKLKISRFEIGGKIDNGYFNNCFLKSIFGV